jgi:hypothetical protein
MKRFKQRLDVICIVGKTLLPFMQIGFLLWHELHKG